MIAIGNKMLQLKYIWREEMRGEGSPELGVVLVKKVKVLQYRSEKRTTTDNDGFESVLFSEWKDVPTVEDDE